MRTCLRVILFFSLVYGGSMSAVPGFAAAPDLPPVPSECVEGTLPGGALSLICVPATGWNGDLVVFAHGYTAFNEGLDFQNLTLPDDVYLPELVQKLGYAFATTSYRRNGLAILEGVEDIRELVAAFPETAGQAARRTYITGASEGGIITTLLVERSPELFSGGLSACGPIGDFRKQINYWGDFRVLFDYFFPDVLPGSPIEIPSQVIDNWESQYVPLVKERLAANQEAANSLIRTSKAKVDRNDPATVTETTLNLLWYNVFATNDGKQQLNGNPYDNKRRLYLGSGKGVALNLRVQRSAADASALASIPPYDTSGNVTIPLITMHTTGDEIIPFWHQFLYRSKLTSTGSTGNVTLIPIFRYGHCNFKTVEVIAAFALLVLKTTGQELQHVPEQYDIKAAQAEFQRAEIEAAQSGLGE